MATYESEHERYWRGVGNAESTGLKATVRGLEQEIEDLMGEVAVGRMWREVAFEARREAAAGAGIAGRCPDRGDGGGAAPGAGAGAGVSMTLAIARDRYHGPKLGTSLSILFSFYLNLLNALEMTTAGDYSLNARNWNLSGRGRYRLKS